MSEYQAIIPVEEVGHYLRRVFLSKMEPRSPPWWAMMSVIERLKTPSPRGDNHDNSSAAIARLHGRIRDLENEICVLKNPEKEPTT